MYPLSTQPFAPDTVIRRRNQAHFKWGDVINCQTEGRNILLRLRGHAVGSTDSFSFMVPLHSVVLLAPKAKTFQLFERQCMHQPIKSHSCKYGSAGSSQSKRVYGNIYLLPRHLIVKRNSWSSVYRDTKSPFRRGKPSLSTSQIL